MWCGRYCILSLVVCIVYTALYGFYIVFYISFVLNVFRFLVRR